MIETNGSWSLLLFMIGIPLSVLLTIISMFLNIKSLKYVKEHPKKKNKIYIISTISTILTMCTPIYMGIYFLWYNRNIITSLLSLIYITVILIMMFKNKNNKKKLFTIQKFGSLSFIIYWLLEMFSSLLG